MSDTARQRRDVERNREAILSAAIAVLADQPTAAMNEIALASGVGRSTLYRHFPDRAALITAIHDRVRLEAEAAIREHLDAAGDRDPIEVLIEITNAVVDLGEGYRFLSNHDAGNRAKQPQDRSRRRGPLTDYIRVAQESGAIRNDMDVDWLVSMLAHTFMAAVENVLSASGSERSRSVIAPTVRSLLTAPAS